jgi:hypothetical protein
MCLVDRGMMSTHEHDWQFALIVYIYDLSFLLVCPISALSFPPSEFCLTKSVLEHYGNISVRTMYKYMHA